MSMSSQSNSASNIHASKTVRKELDLRSNRHQILFKENDFVTIVVELFHHFVEVFALQTKAVAIVELKIVFQKSAKRTKESTFG